MTNSESAASAASAQAIPFLRPLVTGDESAAIAQAIAGGKLCGDGPFSRRVEDWFRAHLGCARALMVPSGTQALEMAALLLDIQPGDEVIMPSFTFVSTANAFVLRGARIVFTDIEPGTMNLDPRGVADAITDRTRAIVPVHYAGVGCDMDALRAIAAPRGIALVEDAAQGIGASRDGRPLGSIGQLAAFSFHETKNLTSGGEGGLLAINDPSLVARAEVLREKGTNRLAFFRGEVDKYRWLDLGSSYLPGELQCAYLHAQLAHLDAVTADRRAAWARYHAAFADLEDEGLVQRPVVPASCQHNGHIYWLVLRDLETRQAVIAALKARGIHAPFHYVPLHSAPAGQRFGRFHGEDVHTTDRADRLIRLPLWYRMGEATQDRVIAAFIAEVRARA